MTSPSNYTALSDECLLLAWRSDDRRAGELLLRRHHNTIARYFRSRLPGDAACEDLVQTTFLGLIEGQARVSEPKKVLIYLYKIADNKLNSHLRVKYRNERLVAYESGLVPSTRTPPFEAVIRTQRKRQLAAALATLPSEMRATLELYYWDKLTTVEIAEVMEVTHSAIKLRLMRGRKRLRPMLDGFE